MKRTFAAPAALTLMVSLAACGGGNDEPAKPKTITVSGTMTLNDSNIGSGGGACWGNGGYDDIRNGAQAVVRNAKGEKVAVGAIGESRAAMSTSCEFTFKFKGVPAGVGPYSVEVSHRGEVAFDEEDAGAIAITLG